VAVASAEHETLAVVKVVPSPASLKVHTNWPLLLIVALALRKCGLSASATAAVASMTASAAVATTIPRRVCSYLSGVIGIKLLTFMSAGLSRGGRSLESCRSRAFT